MVGNFGVGNAVRDFVGTATDVKFDLSDGTDSSAYTAVGDNNIYYTIDSFHNGTDTNNEWVADLGNYTSNYESVTVGTDGTLTLNFAANQPTPWPAIHIGRSGRQCLRIEEGPEEKARRLLLRIAGPEAFRSYLKNGFLSYRARSGKVYQIFPGIDVTKVWDKGEPVEKLCVVFARNELPPTDSVIMRLLMLENSEEEFRSIAVVSSFTPPRKEPKPVVERGRILRMQKDGWKKDGQFTIGNGFIYQTNSESLQIRA